MRRNRVSFLTIASAGLLLSAGAFADEPAFQTPPGAVKPAQPGAPPPFVEPTSAPAAPDPSPAAPPPAAPPVTAPSPAPASAPSPAPVLMPLGEPPAPVRAAPSRPAQKAPRARPIRPAPAEHIATRPKTKAKKRKKGDHSASAGPVASFPAFRIMEGGGSRVFVRMSSKVAVTEHKTQGQLVYRMQGAQVSSRTNQLPLDTSYFATPVGRVRLVPQGDDVDLVIDLRQASEAQHRIEEQRDGAVLVVDFPPPDPSSAPLAPKSAKPERSGTETKRLGGGRAAGPGSDY